MTESVDPEHPLDNAVWASLTSHHAEMAEATGRARRYSPEVSSFVAVDRLDPDSLADLAGLTAGGPPFALFRREIPTLPAPWVELARGGGVQLVVSAAELADGPPLEVRELTFDDVDQVLALVELTKPGPFRPRTIGMGRYLGHYDGDRLVAMAGERLRFHGYTEISAVCTHPDARGRGLASGLTRRVAEGIVERGERAFLHVAHDNDGARRVYEALGFRPSGTVEFVLVEPPEATT